MAIEKVVTVYDTEQHAKGAVRALEIGGFSSNDISLMNKQAFDREKGSVAATRGPAFWESLFGRSVREHEAEVYGRVVEEGGYVLTLRVPDAQVERAMKILDTHESIDVNERAGRYGLGELASVGAVAEIAMTAGGAVGLVEDERVFRLPEEQLNVGKRQVEAGTTRIRRFITERPVEQKISLHEEHAEVMRRTVTNPAYLDDVDWTDTTIEVRETAEEAVVNKTTRVAEEVVIWKKGSDHEETIHDKLRRQEIEIEHVGAGGKVERQP